VGRKLLIGAAVVALAVTAAACGDDDEDTTASTAAAPASEPASSATVAASEPATSASEPASSAAEEPTEASATAASSASGEVVKLGFITKFPVDFFFVLEDAAKAWDEAHPDAEIIFGQGESATDDEGEIALIESMVAQGVKGIAITPTSEAVVPALDKAKEQGVTIVLMDNDIPSWDGKAAVVATDNKKGGTLAGEWLAGKLKAGDTIAVLEGVPGVPALDDRVNGMLDGLGGLDVKVVGKAPTDCAQDKGVAAAEDLLTANPDVTAIYAACGPPVVGAVEALENAGKKPEDIVLVGFDALPDEVANIKAGKEDASVAQFPAKIGELGVDTLWKAVNGEPVEAFVDTGTAIVTADNAAEFE
jgi:simple sugar transport system substrate-binding protein